MPVPAWVTQWVQTLEDELLYATEDELPGADASPALPRAASQVLRAQRGRRMVRHAIIVPLTLAVVARIDDVVEVCEAVYPAQQCACGQYQIRWE